MKEKETERTAKRQARKDRLAMVKRTAIAAGYTWTKYRHVTYQGSGQSNGCISSTRISTGYELKDPSGKVLRMMHTVRELIKWLGHWNGPFKEIA